VQKIDTITKLPTIIVVMVFDICSKFGLRQLFLFNAFVFIFLRHYSILHYFESKVFAKRHDLKSIGDFIPIISLNSYAGTM